MLHLRLNLDPFPAFCPRRLPRASVTCRQPVDSALRPRQCTFLLCLPQINRDERFRLTLRTPPSQPTPPAWHLPEYRGRQASDEPCAASCPTAATGSRLLPVRCGRPSG